MIPDNKYCWICFFDFFPKIGKLEFGGPILIEWTYHIFNTLVTHWVDYNLVVLSYIHQSAKLTSQNISCHTIFQDKIITIIISGREDWNCPDLALRSRQRMDICCFMRVMGNGLSMNIFSTCQNPSRQKHSCPLVIINVHNNYLCVHDCNQICENPTFCLLWVCILYTQY